MNTLQRTFDAMSEAARSTRSRYHLTLGQLIDALQTAKRTATVVFSDDTSASPGDFLSYRGYYADLAIQSVPHATVQDVYEHARLALNNSFEGYKGGTFHMGEDTPLWVSEYGSASGRAIVGIEVGETVVLVVRQLKD